MQLRVVGSFTYRAVDPISGLVEHELDTVLVGDLPNVPLDPDPAEVSATRLVSYDDLERELVDNPAAFTPWLAQALARNRAL